MAILQERNEKKRVLLKENALQLNARKRAEIHWRRHFNRVLRFREWVIEENAGVPVDVCIVHDSHALEAGMAIKEMTGCDLVYDCVEYPDYTGRAPTTQEKFSGDDSYLTQSVHIQEARITSAASTILAGTRGVAEWHLKNPRNVQAKVVRNCLDYMEMPRDTRIREDCGLAENDRLLLYPNTLFPLCGIEQTLDALAMLPEDIHLAIVGPAAEKYLEDIGFRAESLGGRVHILPLRQPGDLLEYRSGADCSLIPFDPSFPNHATCLPNRVFESIMSRTPLIISDLPYIKELITEHHCGLAFEDFSAESLAETIREFYRHFDFYRNNVAEAAKVLCWEHERKVYLEALEPTLRGRKHLKVLFLANKPIDSNRRMFRHSRELADLGHQVTVQSLRPPFSEFQDARISYMGIREPFMTGMQIFPGLLGAIARQKDALHPGRDGVAESPSAE